MGVHGVSWLQCGSQVLGIPCNIVCHLNAQERCPNGDLFLILAVLCSACSVRVSNELGAGHPKSASFSVKVVTSLSLLVASVMAVVVMCLRDHISYVFTRGDDVARAVSAMTPLLAVTIVLNGIQPVLSGDCIIN
jgi:multidrug resistance protein, MATE family